MCLAFPGKIISINGDFAMVDFNGIKKEVNILLTPDAKKRDYVIVHTGFAIQKMNKKEAKDKRF
ncbi:HypC/HybG/HupF family hydrogenase formation chaperone [Candidatus Kuenenbacteria bacterium]|nr:HypC/HybG/HupF family hydrogenase formation chaperone [Candidatus Kuenenbacteria bacterium]